MLRLPCVCQVGNGSSCLANMSVGDTYSIAYFCKRGFPFVSPVVHLQFVVQVVVKLTAELLSYHHCM